MRSVLEGLDKGETVTITHQGKKRAVLVPIKTDTTKSITEHEFFGMNNTEKSVEEIMSELRKKRYDF